MLSFRQPLNMGLFCDSIFNNHQKFLLIIISSEDGPFPKLLVNNEDTVIKAAEGQDDVATLNTSVHVPLLHVDNEFIDEPQVLPEDGSV